MVKEMTDVPSGKKEDEYQAQEDARTMQRMGEIMSDPKRHKKAQAKLAEMMSDMKKSQEAMRMMRKVPRASKVSKQKEYEIDRELGGAKHH